MKHLSKLVLFLAVLAMASCDKADKLPSYQNGSAPVLSASSVNVAPAATDSNSTVLTLSWTSPAYSVDTSTVKYVVEIDSVGKNFSRPYTKVVMGGKSASFVAKDLNAFFVGRGYAFNVPVSMEARVISSYSNNNERLFSNVVPIKFTPYKIPPKVVLPASGRLFLVGSATQGGWNNPVPTPSQEFSRLDETTFAGIFQLNGNSEYLVLPVNGDWSHKYSVADNTVAGLNGGGNFGYDLAQNIPGPTAAGWYKIVIDFQTGKFRVTPYNSVLPTNLFIVGDATNGGWNNPVPVPAQQLTRLNSSEWKITLPLIGGKQYLLLPNNGDWSHKYSVASNSVTGLASGGEFGYDLSDNFPGPAASGTYTITVNFAAPTTAGNSAGRFTVQ